MNVVLHASYFAPNFGDALLWNAGIDAVEDASVGAEIYSVGVPDALKDYYKHKLLKGSWPKSKSADVFCFLGGGYFFQPNGGHIKWGLRNLLRHYRAFEVANRSREVGIFGVGVGEIDFYPLRRLVQAQLRRAKHVYLRDQESIDAASRIYGREAGCELATDQAFGYVATRFESLVASAVQRPYLSLHLDLHGFDADRQNLILKKVEQACAGDSRPIQVLVDCSTRHTERDLEKVNAIFGRRIEKVSIYKGDLGAFLGAISESDLLVTTKLHVGICATALKVPVIAVPKHAKAKRFYKQAGLERYCFDIARLGSEIVLSGVDSISDVQHASLVQSSLRSMNAVTSFVRESLR